jgi:cell wall-associated NlpC family hydrolase
VSSLPTLRARWIAAVLVLTSLASPMVQAQQAELGDASAAASKDTRLQPAAGVAEAGPADFATETVRATEQVASYALQMVGTVYRFGGAEPATGFDCSGLVQYVYRQVSGVTLPRTAKSLSEVGLKIPMVGLLPGDLVFFNTRRFAYSHVGIYIGHNQFIHAPRTGERVEVSTIDSRYWQRRFNGARRLVGSVPGLLPALVDQAQAAASAAFMSDPAESADSVGF